MLLPFVMNTCVDGIIMGAHAGLYHTVTIILNINK